jgi:hypothetical protein
MKTLPIAGKLAEVPFYEDDTIERVRELIAIHHGSHPDRLFIQVRVTLPEGYYRTPREWTDLFFRLSRDGQTVTEEVLQTYLTDVRPGVTFPSKAYTREQWEAVSIESAIRDGGQEWHILGAKMQTILPLPPKDVALPTNRIPLLSLQSLFETIHPFDPSELRVTELPADPSDSVLRAYFPRVQPETPPNMDASKVSILKAQEDLGGLLALVKPSMQHRTETVTRAKWYIALNATSITTPRTTFEQMFYGLTVSEETPCILYFTSEGNALRSKYYVENPTTKVPTLDPTLVKAWYNATTPNRTRPTLLLYRKGPKGGTSSSRTVFQRIAITSSDITIDIRKDKSSTKTKDELRAEAEEWLLSLDAIAPSLDMRDLASDRWDLADLSLHASYAKEETEFDMLRFPCLQTIFGHQAGTFRLLRSEQGDIPRRVVDACQALTRDGATPTATYLAAELGTSTEEAASLLESITSGDINCDRSLRDFPTITFHRKDVEVQFATNIERTLKYVDILRYVLTANSDDVNDVCPRRKEMVGPSVVVPQEATADEEEDEGGDDLLAMLGLSETPASNAAAAPEPVVKPSRMLKVAQDQKTTQNYFNERLKAFDAKLFGPPYARECEKNSQVVVLTPEAKETIRSTKGAEYTYEEAPAEEQMDIPNGTAICPPYWCMTDLIPLREDQLEEGTDGAMHCPVCKGKVRPNDKVSTKEFPVIKRETSKGKVSRYPRAMQKHDGVPCCYPTPAKEAVVLNSRLEVTYVLTEELRDIPAKRVARLSPELASRLGVKTTYDKTIVKGRLEFQKEDVFRIGLGPRPRDVLPGTLVPAKLIVSPKERPDIVRRCSFFSALRSADPIEEVERRWQDGTLDPLDEVEYLSFLLEFNVILVAMDRFKVLCGFQSQDVLARGQTLVLLLRKGGHPEVLGTMRRQKKGAGGETIYKVDITAAPLNAMTTKLIQAHQEACTGDLPHLADALIATREFGRLDYEGVTDPSGRLQALLVPGRVILPFVPTTQTLATRVPVKMLHEILDADLPTYADEVAALNSLKSERLFRHEPSKDRRNGEGLIVEVSTVMGFRVPVRPSAPPSSGPVAEVMETIRKATGVDASGNEIKGEQVLVSGTEDPDGRKEKDKIDYRSELVEFLLFSLANDIAPAVDDEARDVNYFALRRAIDRKDTASLGRLLADWYGREAYEDGTDTAYKFISKVRKPCGQLKSEETCSKSSLCGWDKNDCKVQVRTSRVTPAEILEQIRTLLLTNDKQRALVLDNRLSRFFSTVLYLEMPNETIRVGI